MSDIPRPPSDDVPGPEPAVAPDSGGGLWQRYRSLPLGLQILAPVVIVAVIVGVVVWATSGSDGDVAGTETTAAGGVELEDVLKGLIVVGAIRDPTVATTEPASTPAPATPPAATIESAATTESPTATSPPTTMAAPTTTEAPGTTEAPATTQAPVTTEEPVTTDEPVTIEPPVTTDAPTTTRPSQTLPPVTAFIAQWNSATAGTEVPTISAAEATELTGDYAGYYLITLTPTGNGSPPQVGIVGTLTSPGSGQLAEVLLAWIPGADEGSGDFYWECFGVLVGTVSPGTTPAETTALESTLGRAPGVPPFTTTASASNDGLDYRSFPVLYSGDAGTVDVSAIAVG